MSVSRVLVLTALLGLGVACPAAHAQVYQWRTDAPSNDWASPGNWQGGTAPVSSLTNTEIIYTSSSATFPYLDSGYSVSEIAFQSATNGYDFNHGSLTLGTLGILQNSTYEEIFDIPVSLGSNSAWALLSTGALTFDQGLANGGHLLTIQGGTSTLNGAITGTGGLYVSMSGTLNLTGASTYTGATTLAGGTLSLAGGGSLAYTIEGNGPGPGLSVGAGATLAVGSGGSISYANTFTSYGQNITLNGTSASPAQGTLASGGVINGRYLYLGSSSGGYGTFTQSGGTLTTSDLGAFGVEVGSAGGSNGTYNLQAGTLTTYATDVGDSGTGVFNQTGGTHTSTQELNIGASLGGTGTFNLSDSGSGSILNTKNVEVGLFGMGVFNQTGGTHTASGTLTLGDSSGNPGDGATGTYNLSGGSLSTAGTVLGISGFGTFNQTGGTHTVSGTFTVGDGTGGLTPTGSGTYNLSAGSLSTAAATVGLSNAGTFTQTGGAFSTGGNTLTLGGNASGTGSYTLSGNGSLATGTMDVGGSGTGVFTQRGGTVAITAGSTLVLGQNSGGVGTYNLDGGTLTTGGVSLGSGAGTFNFGGGTLQANANSTGFLTGLNTVNVQASGVIIDTQSFSVTVGQNLRHDATGGAIDGGLTKLGSGTLTLGSANTYTGDTVVRAGTLSVNDPTFLGASTSAVDLFNGASLVITNGNVTTGRTYNLGTSTLGPASGGSITYRNATVNNGILGAGNQIVSDGTTLNDTRTVTGTVLTQNGSKVTFNNVILGGNTAFTQSNGASLSTTGDFTTEPQTTTVLNGTMNVVGAELSGAVTINQNGRLNESGSATPLYLDGSQGTTVNVGGRLTAASGSTIELGGLLVNNGTQTGVLDINLGGVARGTGSFDTVNVGAGGQFGNGSVAGGTGNAVVPGASPFWRALDRAAANNPLPLVGPQPSTTPQVFTVQNLTLKAGGTFDFNLQNTQEAAGVGYDLTNVGNQLTLQGSAAAGGQIVVRLIGLDANGNPGTVATFDGTQSYTFTLVHTASGIVGYVPGEFTVNTASFSNSTPGGSFSVVQQGNDLVLVYSAVPEPGTWALIGLGAGLLGLGLRRRRRQTR